MKALLDLSGRHAVFTRQNNASSNIFFFHHNMLGMCLTNFCHRSPYVGIQQKWKKRDFFYGYNVIAYFEKWEDRSSKHFLPANVQKILSEHADEFFYG